MDIEEVREQIEAITKELGKGEFDSYGQKEKVQKMLDNIYFPAEALRDVRFEELGSSLYGVTALTVKDGAQRITLPMLRADEKGLFKFLVVLEKLGILENAIEVDMVIKLFTTSMRNTIISSVEQVSKEEGDVNKRLLLSMVAHLIFTNTSRLVEDNKVPMLITTEMISFVLQYSNPDGSINYKAMGERFFKASKKYHTFDGLGISVTTAMLYWSSNPQENRTSQKARGIQAAGDRRIGSDEMWDREPALFLKLDDAKNCTPAEVAQSVRLTFSNVPGAFNRGLFIRTCPASPRPGALENIKAHTPVELIEGLQYLAGVMLDPKKPDYDPEGCLCIMQFIEPACSAVMVLGHDEIVIGPSFDTVTAGGGSNIVIPISKGFAAKVEMYVQHMDLKDGMEHHELEFVWPAGIGSSRTMSRFEQLWKRSKVTWTSKPVITQVRGLAAAKPQRTPPPVVDGIALHIRGSVPTGAIIQANHINVKRGTLTDCMELEQMVKEGTLPHDLVIYVPAGSSNCHAGGVALEHGLAIIYGELPWENGTQWTETGVGWVTDRDAEPSPFDPEMFREYYVRGCEDGDRFWQYQTVVLSQFFHSFINKTPRNDPRLEAYFAGVYTTWILKATLAVAIGEGRHAYLGQKASFHPIHGLTHIFLTTVLNRGTDFHWTNRSAYYKLFQNTEIGLDNIHNTFKSYERIFSECHWPGGGYGGKNYKESVQKGTAAAAAMQGFRKGDVPLRTLLNAVNTLEGAVHNCAFFFNKFVNDKKFFDIGTSHHIGFAKIEHQFHIAALFHYHFYKEVVKEPHVLWEGYEETHLKHFSDYKQLRRVDQDHMDCVFAAIADTGKEDMLHGVLQAHPVLDNYLKAFCLNVGDTYCEECDSNDCGCMDGEPVTFHHQGICASTACPLTACKNAALVETFDLTIEAIKPLSKIFMLAGHGRPPYTSEKYNTGIGGQLAVLLSEMSEQTSEPLDENVGERRAAKKVWMEQLFSADIDSLGNLCHDLEAAVFIAEEREFVPPSTTYEIYTDESMLEAMPTTPLAVDWKSPMIFSTEGRKVVFLGEMQKQVWQVFCLHYAQQDIKSLIIDLSREKFDDYLLGLLEAMQNLVSTEDYLAYQGARTQAIHDWRGITPHNLYFWYLRMYLSKRWNDEESEIHPVLSSQPPTSHYISSADIFQILLTKFDLDFVKEVLQI